MSEGYFEIFEDTIADSVSDLLDKLGIVDVQTIISYEGGLEPDKTYCVIDVLDADQVGRVDKATTLKSRDEEVLETLAHYVGAVQVSVVGKRASQVASVIHHNITNNQVGYDILAKYGLGILTRSGLRKIPQQRESQWVKSFNMDLSVSFAVYITQAYDWIEYVTINGNNIRIYND